MDLPPSISACMRPPSEFVTENAFIYTILIHCAFFSRSFPYFVFTLFIYLLTCFASLALLIF